MDPFVFPIYPVVEMSMVDSSISEGCTRNSSWSLGGFSLQSMKYVTRFNRRIHTASASAVLPHNANSVNVASLLKVNFIVGRRYTAKIKYLQVWSDTILMLRSYAYVAIWHTVLIKRHLQFRLLRWFVLLLCDIYICSIHLPQFCHVLRKLLSSSNHRNARYSGNKLTPLA